MRRLLMLTAGLLACLWLLAPASALAEGEEEDGYLMNDLRATVHLPPKWEVLPGGWSDWDFKAKASDGLVEMRMHFTPFQVTPTEEAAQGWIKMHRLRLEKHKAESVQVARVEISERQGRPTAEMDLEFVFEGGKVKGVYQAVAFPAYGKVVHIAMMSNDKKAARATKSLSFFLEHLEIHKEVEPVDELYGRVSSPVAFEHTLPDGWRAFAKSELGPVAELAKKTGQGKYDREHCWAAIKPLSFGDPDFMIFCQGGLLLDKVDEYSWAGVEPVVNDKFFGGTSLEVEPAEKVVIGDRLGYFYRPPSRGDTVLMAVAPYDQGVVVGWARAQSDRAAQLEEDFRTVLTGARFTGPNGGEQPVGGLGGWFVYSIRYRPTNPLFLGPVLLVFFGFMAVVVVLAKHKPKNLEDY